MIGPPQQTGFRQPTKVMMLITEDWFLLSHFQPVVRALVAAGADVVVVTTSSGRLYEIEALGARTIALDFARASLHPAKQAQIVGKLCVLMRRERPDVVHAIALKAIALGGLACRLAGAGNVARLVMHLTGSGPAGPLDPRRVPTSYAMTIRLIQWLLKGPATTLLVENDDDAARIAGPDWRNHPKVGVLGGAGVDPDVFPAAPWSPRTPAAIGFLGRMLSTKGVATLVDAHRLLLGAGTEADLILGGEPDVANRWAVPASVLSEWAIRPRVRWIGKVDDPASFWRSVDIAVVPSSWGEGMPRVLLEAASTARPLIVTDVPGCRHFVRHEREGLIVPPNDPEALAAALKRLIDDGALAARLGAGARERLLGGFTERHVAEAVIAAYMRLLK